MYAVECLQSANFNLAEKEKIQCFAALRELKSIKVRSYNKHFATHIVGWEQERLISARRVRTSYLDSARKNVPSQLGA